MAEQKSISFKTEDGDFTASIDEEEGDLDINIITDDGDVSFRLSFSSAIELSRFLSQL